MTVAYPNYERELIALGEADQAEIKAHYQIVKRLSSDEERQRKQAQLKADCHARATRMFMILHDIKLPTISNVGRQGSAVISLLALHSYLDEMKQVLDAYRQAYEHDPNDVFNEAIPSLTDRIMVFEQRRQRYGTNWYNDAAGRFFLVPVKDFAHMNDRRAAFGLEPRMRPTVFAIGEQMHPLGQGLAEASDQKPMTDEEHHAFIQGHVR